MSLRMNVGSGERWLRVVAGFMMTAAGLYFLRGMLSGYLMDAAGLMLMLTGILRWCPMCYIGGRRLPENR